MSRCINLDECKCSIKKCDKCDNDAVLKLSFIGELDPIAFYCINCSPEYYDDSKEEEYDEVD